jgi:16S rRNA (cytidine1402-2'-O)-methyltransferase
MVEHAETPLTPGQMPPGLYIVATPIGNLGDLSPRAAATLANASVIACEDTRVTAKLLAHIGARVPMLPLHDHNEAQLHPQLVARAAAEAVALVSDAGTPLISDPGFKLVRAARAAGVNIVTIPGPCAAIAALTLSGLPTDRFLFAGFLPARAGARASAIAELAPVPASLVFYETGPRLAEALAALAAGLGDRPAAIGRELTKQFEECVTGTLAELAAHYAALPAPKGEIVITIGPPLPAPAADAAMLDAALTTAMAAQSLKSAVAAVAAQLGLPRSAVYARALALKG